MTRNKIVEIMKNVTWSYNSVADEILKALEEERKRNIELGECYGSFSKEDEDYIITPTDGRFKFGLVCGKKGQLVFIPEAK